MEAAYFASNEDWGLAPFSRTWKTTTSLEIDVRPMANDPNSWSSDEINTVKSLVADCLPYVRFVDIIYDELIEK